MASTYYWCGRYDDAIAQAQRTVELDLSSPPRISCSRGSYAHKRYADAIESQKKVLTPCRRAGRRGRAARDHAAGGYDVALRNFYRGVLAGLSVANKEGWVSAVAFALVYTKLGDANRAFEWLDKAYAERTPWMAMLRADPDFEPLRGDPRFAALAKRIGLP